MKISRSLATVSITLAALAAAGGVSAVASDSPAATSGGALAEPTVQQHGGGPAAPAREREADAAAKATPEGGGSAPPTQAAQDDQPTTPGGEEQNGGEQNGGETQPDEPVETEEDGGVVPDTGDDTGSATSGLPSTGLELGAMAVIGLGLLMLGAALRPGRSVPPGAAGRDAPTPRPDGRSDDQRTTRAALTVAALLLKVRNTLRSIRKNAFLRLSFLPAV